MKQFLFIFIHLWCLFTITVTTTKASDNVVSCQDENGKLVDWFMAYKFPMIHDNGRLFDSGFAYAYITDVNSDKKTPRLSQQSSQIPSTNIHQNTKNVTNQHKDNSTFRGTSKATLSSPHLTRHTRHQPRVSWVVSDKLVSDQNSVILRTLSILYKQRRSDTQLPDKINFLLYNDQEPNEEDDKLNERNRPKGNKKNNISSPRYRYRQRQQRSARIPRSGATNSDKAHAKGVLIIDDVTRRGVWLTHSVPLFPPLHNETLAFGNNAKRYGQTFMCINFNLKDYGSALANHLITMNPNVYDFEISDRLYELVPEFRKLISRRRQTKQQDNGDQIVQKIQTLGGHELTLFSKSKNFDEDLYSSLVGSNLGTDLYVESWRNGNGEPLNSSCPKNRNHVNNIEDLQVKLEDRNAAKSDVTWHYSKDHSKWAISEDESSEIVCISDINRMRSQFKRGGGSACMRCSTCWSVFANTIKDVEPCSLNRLSVSTQGSLK